MAKKTAKKSPAKQKHYRLSIADERGRYSTSFFWATEEEALAAARQRLEWGAVYVRVDTDVDEHRGTSTLVAELRGSDMPSSSRHHSTKKSPAELQREIDEALAKPAFDAGRRSHSTKKSKKQLKIYNVDASIIAGNSDETVWKGSFELPAASKKEAGQRALDILHDSPYYDDRIDPRAEFQVWLNYAMDEMTAEDIAQETRAFIKRAREEVGASST